MMLMISLCHFLVFDTFVNAERADVEGTLGSHRDRGRHHVYYLNNLMGMKDEDENGGRKRVAATVW
jgi:hypothetical protein